MEGVCERQIFEENMSVINRNTFVRTNIVMECGGPHENKHFERAHHALFTKLRSSIDKL